MVNRPLVIYGNGRMSSLAWYCMANDALHDVVGFTVDRPYIGSARHEGLPVVPFDELERFHAPGTVDTIVPIGFHAINGLRKERFEALLARGYSVTNYVASRASIWPSLEVKRNCMIYEGAILSPFVNMGENVTVRSNSFISHHCVIGNHVFIAAAVTLGGGVVVKDQAFIGLGAIIREGVTISERSFICAGAVVISDTEPDCIYLGNPARRIGGNALDHTT